MSIHAGRSALGACVGAASVWACLTETPRPSPPSLAVALNKVQVRSPDTLRVTVSAQDPDGIDSVWVTVDSLRKGDDAFLRATAVDSFFFTIQAGATAQRQIPVRVEARDVPGFKSSLDTSVQLVP